MATKSLVIEITKGERLHDKNYDMWHRKVHYFLNEHDLLDHLTSNMCPPEVGNSAQHRCDHEAYDLWLKRDRSARFTLFECTHDDLIEEFEYY